MNLTYRCTLGISSLQGPSFTDQRAVNRVDNSKVNGEPATLLRADVMGSKIFKIFFQDQ